MSFVLTQLSQADGFKTLDLPCLAFSDVDLAGGYQDFDDYMEEDYGGGAYFEGGYGYAADAAEDLGSSSLLLIC